ncbi:TlpA family protein disulfide reductase [Streptomyces sp. LX-29]|uniref:TlpA disulfide reductase family protein n=1 Tax=Streptomyces sp. LX-29 TaxID=2900152 RepID=UPI00240E7567|nr:TlpA disulfide reductase family protein [Streptomyces sp. LX-29]WFB10373.1 TlpA family protein disulfide reductase [Streptomyces sp. LX-29]
MPFLIAAVILVGVLCVLDLILTLGVVRRLREHTELLANANSGLPAGIAVGEEIGDFTAATVDGETLRRADLDGETVVAFFSPTCQPCRRKMPKFVEFAKAMPGGRDRVLAAVIGDPDEAAEFAAQLGPVARVVVEGDDSGLVEAFRTSAFPTLLRVSPDEAGRLVVKATDVRLDRPALVA